MENQQTNEKYIYKQRNKNKAGINLILKENVTNRKTTFKNIIINIILGQLLNLALTQIIWIWQKIKIVTRLFIYHR